MYITPYDDTEPDTTDTQTDSVDGTDENNKFNQEDVNRFLADDRRKHQNQMNKLREQLEEAQKNSGDPKEKAELQQQIDYLKSNFQTEQQKAKENLDKTQKKYKKEVDELNNDRNAWKSRYETSEIRRGITDAAADQEAVSPGQIVRFLEPDTFMSEDLDEEGKPTGEFTPKVKYKDVDEDGKDILLELSVPEAVKRMKNKPEEFGNLFKTKAKSGLGETTLYGGKGATDVDVSDTATYRQQRKSGQTKRIGVS